MLLPRSSQRRSHRLHHRAGRIDDKHNFQTAGGHLFEGGRNERPVLQHLELVEGKRTACQAKCGAELHGDLGRLAHIYSGDPQVFALSSRER